MRLNPNPIIGKHAISPHLLIQRNIRRPNRHRQKRRNIARHTKPVRRLNHLPNAVPVRQLQRRNIPRLRKRIQQRHRALVVALIVVRRIRPVRRRKSRRPIDDDIRRLRSRLNRRRIHIRLERRSHLTLRLRSPIELRQRKIATTHHRQHLAARIIHRHHRSLRSRVLLHGRPQRPLRPIALDPYINHIARLQKTIRVHILRPLPVLRRHHRILRAQPHQNLLRRNLHHHAMNVAPFIQRLRPVRMFIVIDIRPIQHHILQPALPPVPALIRRRPIQNRLDRHLLQIEIQRRINLQPRAMHLFHAIFFFELPPHLLHKVRRYTIHRRLDMQPQRRSLRRICLLLRDLPIRQHLADHQVPAPQRPLRIPHRRIRLRPLRQRRQQRRLRQRQRLHMLAEVVLRTRFKPIRPAPKINLIRIQLEDLLLGKPSLDLHRKKDLLQLAPIGLLGRKKQIPRQLHRQRRRPLRPPIRMQVAIRRPHRPHQVYPPVAFKALVFNRDDRLPQHRRKIRIRQHHPPLQRKRPKHRAMNIQQLRRRIRTIPRQIIHLRQIDRVHHHQAAQPAKHSRQTQQNKKGDLPCHTPARIVRPIHNPTQQTPPLRLIIEIRRSLFATVLAQHGPFTIARSW